MCHSSKLAFAALCCVAKKWNILDSLVCKLGGVISIHCSLNLCSFYPSSWTSLQKNNYVWILYRGIIQDGGCVCDVINFTNPLRKLLTDHRILGGNHVISFNQWNCRKLVGGKINVFVMTYSCCLTSFSAPSFGLTLNCISGFSLSFSESSLK